MAKHIVQVVAEVTGRPDEVYHYWNERIDYPRFVPDLIAVQPLDEVWSRWSLASGHSVDVELTDAVPSRYVSWRFQRSERDRTNIRLWPSGAGATRIEVEVSWHASDDEQRPQWLAWTRGLVEGFTDMLRVEHRGYVETLSAQEQLPHTD